LCFVKRAKIQITLVVQLKGEKREEIFKNNLLVVGNKLFEITESF
jgi:hypothetical protein